MWRWVEYASIVLCKRERHRKIKSKAKKETCRQTFVTLLAQGKRGDAGGSG